MTASPACNYIKRLQVSVIVLLPALFLTVIISALGVPVENAVAIATSESKTLFPDKDAFVYSANPNATGAPDDQIFVGYDKLYDFRKERGLLHFNVAEVPAGSVVTRATLGLWLASWQRPSGSHASMRVGVHALNKDWNEMSVTWNLWPGHGGEVAYRDVSPDLEGWYEFDVTPLVQAWVRDSLANHGFALIGDESEGYHDRSFWSKDCDPAKCGGYALPITRPGAIFETAWQESEPCRGFRRTSTPGYDGSPPRRAGFPSPSGPEAVGRRNRVAGCEGASLRAPKRPAGDAYG